MLMKPPVLSALAIYANKYIYEKFELACLGYQISHLLYFLCTEEVRAYSCLNNTFRNKTKGNKPASHLQLIPSLVSEQVTGSELAKTILNLKTVSFYQGLIIHICKKIKVILYGYSALGG